MFVKLMSLRSYLLLALAGSGLLAADAPTPLFDDQLSQWETWLAVPNRSFEVPGYTRGATPKEDPVLGLNRDPLHVFTAKTVDGDTVLHITGQVFGALTTLKTYDNFYLKTEQRWGEEKWEPKLKAVRDNGILIFCVGPHGVGGKSWMRSQECQVQEGDTGDYWPIDGTMADIPSRVDGKTVVFDPKAPLRLAKNRSWHGPDYQDKPHGEWNTIEIYTLKGDAVFVYNGKVVNILINSRYVEKGSTQEIPLRAGRIQIQSEGAACEYRRMTIAPLKAWPESLAPLMATFPSHP